MPKAPATPAPAVISNSQGYGNGVDVGAILQGEGVNNNDPTASAAANLQTQAAIANALLPYIQQLGGFNQAVNNNGQALPPEETRVAPKPGQKWYGQVPFVNVPMPRKAGVSAINKQLNSDLSMIANPAIRSQLQATDTGIDKAISGLVPAVAQTNATMGPADLIDTLMQAIQSRIDYYGNANAIPAINQNPITHSLADVLAAVENGSITIPYTPLSTQAATATTQSAAKTPAPAASTTPATATPNNAAAANYLPQIPGWQAIANLFAPSQAAQTAHPGTAATMLPRG